MRPDILNPLFVELTSLKGIGEKLGKLLQNLLRGEAGPARMVDALLHLPTSVIDRRFRCTISQLPVQGVATLEVTIGRHKVPPRGSRLPYRVEAFDETGRMTLVFFAAHAEHMQRHYPEGERRFISGEISWFNNEAQMTHPDFVLNGDDFATMPQIEPIYPLKAGISNKVMRRVANDALARLPQMAEWQDSAWLAKQGWPTFSDALQNAHHPFSPEIATLQTQLRQRLAFDELLANQLALVLVRSQMKRETGRIIDGPGQLRAAIIAALPYSLTKAQQTSLAEILTDMRSAERMMRLLQGDVGSGKTVVALLALSTCVESGAQGALMAPTEILARQHFFGLSKLVAHTPLRLALLTGREKGKVRERILAALAAGEIDVLIGTHALFQEGVSFNDLALVVIDEQHRFGVHQRMALQSKSKTVADLLVMTATPIPRTLTLTVYGDMEVSKLTGKPAGRLPIDTRVIPAARIDEVITGLARNITGGIRAYWVCALVEESEKLDLAAAQARFEVLSQHFPKRVGLVHGRMKSAEKDAVMTDFKSGLLAVLVATTVIEVGVDVQEASIMVIENAERFGLSQLHQLRGRVGRGTAKSSCILLYQEPLGETARQRLSIMRETEDGFRIAEEDLKLRGAGEMLGTAQSGIPLFKLADLSVHGELLQAARDDANLVLARDPLLTSPRGQALRSLLYLFERDVAIRLLASG